MVIAPWLESLEESREVSTVQNVDGADLRNGQNLECDNLQRAQKSVEALATDRGERSVTLTHLDAPQPEMLRRAAGSA